MSWYADMNVASQKSLILLYVVVGCDGMKSDKFVPVLAVWFLEKILKKGRGSVHSD